MTTSDRRELLGAIKVMILLSQDRDFLCATRYNKGGVALSHRTACIMSLLE